MLALFLPSRSHFARQLDIHIIAQKCVGLHTRHTFNFLQPEYTEWMWWHHSCLIKLQRDIKSTHGALVLVFPKAAKSLELAWTPVLFFALEARTDALLLLLGLQLPARGEREFWVGGWRKRGRKFVHSQRGERESERERERRARACGVRLQCVAWKRGSGLAFFVRPARLPSSPQSECAWRLFFLLGRRKTSSLK